MRGRPKKFVDEIYEVNRQIWQTDSKRLIQNNHYKVTAVMLLSNYVNEGNKIPHFDYILDNEAFRSGSKYTYTYKQTVFTELGRLYELVLDHSDKEFALDFLVKYTADICEVASMIKMTVRVMELNIRDKRKEVQGALKENRESS